MKKALSKLLLRSKLYFLLHSINDPDLHAIFRVDLVNERRFIRNDSFKVFRLWLKLLNASKLTF